MEFGCDLQKECGLTLAQANALESMCNRYWQKKSDLRLALTELKTHGYSYDTSCKFLVSSGFSYPDVLECLSRIADSLCIQRKGYDLGLE